MAMWFQIHLQIMFGVCRLRFCCLKLNCLPCRSVLLNRHVMKTKKLFDRYSCYGERKSCSIASLFLYRGNSEKNYLWATERESNFQRERETNCPCMALCFMLCLFFLTLCSLHLRCIQSIVFLSHTKSTPASQQYFSLTKNQHQPPVPASRTQCRSPGPVSLCLCV